MERIRPPFGKVIKRAIHTRETFSHLVRTAALGARLTRVPGSQQQAVPWQQKGVFCYL